MTYSLPTIPADRRAAKRSIRMMDITSAMVAEVVSLGAAKLVSLGHQADMMDADHANEILAHAMKDGGFGDKESRKRVESSANPQNPTFEMLCCIIDLDAAMETYFAQ